MTLQLFVGLWPPRQFSNHFYTDGKTHGRGISTSKGRYLHTGQNKHRINAQTQTSMLWVGFEPTISAFVRAKTVHSIDRAATVMDIVIFTPLKYLQPGTVIVSMILESQQSKNDEIKRSLRKRFSERATEAFFFSSLCTHSRPAMNDPQLYVVLGFSKISCRGSFISVCFVWSYDEEVESVHLISETADMVSILFGLWCPYWKMLGEFDFMTNRSYENHNLHCVQIEYIDILYRRVIILVLLFLALIITQLFHLNMQFYSAYELLSLNISVVTDLNWFIYRYIMAVNTTNSK
jgi:hypothetical protein